MAHDHLSVPDPDAGGMLIKEWVMEPGDAVAFNFLTLHGARGNSVATTGVLAPAGG